MKQAILNVKKIFEERGLSRYALGEILNVPHHTVDALFEGRQKLTIQQLHSVSEFFEIDLQDMLKR